MLDGLTTFISIVVERWPHVFFRLLLFNASDAMVCPRTRTGEGFAHHTLTRPGARQHRTALSRSRSRIHPTSALNSAESRVNPRSVLGELRLIAETVRRTPSHD